MLLAAEWVVPSAGLPIRNGAVRVRGSRIDAVGEFDELSAAYPGDPVHEYAGCTMMPGPRQRPHASGPLMHEGTRPAATVPRVAEIHARRRSAALDADDMAASTTYGAILSIAAGTTVVGDIAYGPEALAIAADAGLGGTFFWEVFGMTLRRICPSASTNSSIPPTRDASAPRDCAAASLRTRPTPPALSS